MNDQCSIVRDLIPLVIDHAASSDSAQLVKTHVAGCQACQTYYDEITAAQGAAALKQAQQEKQAFQKAAQRLKIRRRAKKIAMIAAYVLAAVLIVAGLFAGWTGLLMELPSSSIDTKIVQLERGTAVVLTGSHYDKETVRYIATDNNGDVHLSLESHMFGHRLDDNLDVGYTSLTDGIDLNQLTRITYGRDKVVLWQQGDTVTPASWQMEEYYAALDALQAYHNTLQQKYEQDGAMLDHALTPEEKETYLSLARDAAVAFELVPEWAGSQLHPDLPFIPSYIFGEE